MLISLSSLFFFFIALLVISFLVFIHELGHYWMARRVGMRVETFSIGFGKPIYSWKQDGVTWQVCWILFGGYVRIAGEEESEEETSSELPSTPPAPPATDTFSSKSPLDRIKVALMGPLMNILFAIVAFTAIWLLHGVNKPFSDYTHKIGWVDPKSELFAKGVRPGDEITSYGTHVYTSSKDHFAEPILAKGQLTVNGYHVNPTDGTKNAFSYDVALYPHPAVLDREITTAGILAPARYLNYDPTVASDQTANLPQNPSVTESGLQAGDRIVWADGEVLYSLAQLNALVNSQRSLLTIQRDGQPLLRRVPRVTVSELKLEPDFKEELIDWQFEAGLNGTKLQQLWMVPYNLTLDCVVENEVRFIDAENQEEAFPKTLYATLEEPLKVGDKILAIDGTPIKFAYQLLYQLQQHKALLIVERDSSVKEPSLWTEADANFDQALDVKAIQSIANTIGTNRVKTHFGPYVLLKPITPIKQADLMAQSSQQAQYTAQLEEQTKQVEAIEDAEKRSHLLALLKKKQDELVLGIPGIQDQMVIYNPPPTTVLYDMTVGFWRNLYAFFTGALSPKWFMGPIGIIQVVHNSWANGLQEGLFWMGFISLNLGIFNLLPIPLLDGGTILFCLIEMVTRQRLKPKVMEKIVLVSALILIGFFLFVSYNDVLRLIKKFVPW